MIKEQAKQLIALAEGCQRQARAARVATDQLHAAVPAGTAVTAQMLSACITAHSSAVDGLTKLTQAAAVSTDAEMKNAVTLALNKANAAMAAFSALGPGATVAELAKIQPLDEDAVTAVEGVNALVAGSQEVVEAVGNDERARLSPGERLQRLGAWSICVIALLAVGAVICSLGFGTFVPKLAQNDIARGLITFLLSVATVVIAVLLVVSALLMGNTTEEADKRFTRGKEVLTVLIGVFGTILGFYYGSAKGETKPGLEVSPIAVARSSVTNATIAAEISGGLPPYKFSIQFKKPAPPPEPVTDRESKEGKISLVFTNLPSPLEFTLTATDKGTNRTSREFKEQ